MTFGSEIITKGSSSISLLSYIRNLEGYKGITRVVAVISIGKSVFFVNFIPQTFWIFSFKSDIARSPFQYMFSSMLCNVLVVLHLYGQSSSHFLISISSPMGARWRGCCVNLRKQLICIRFSIDVKPKFLSRQLVIAKGYYSMEKCAFCLWIQFNQSFYSWIDLSRKFLD